MLLQMFRCPQCSGRDVDGSRRLFSPGCGQCIRLSCSSVYSQETCDAVWSACGRDWDRCASNLLDNTQRLAACASFKSCSCGRFQYEC